MAILFNDLEYLEYNEYRRGLLFWKKKKEKRFITNYFPME